MKMRPGERENARRVRFFLEIKDSQIWWTDDVKILYKNKLE